MIRVYQHGDHSEIAQIFSSAIHEIASEWYSREQCYAWAGRIPNEEYWRKRCELKRPFVSVEQGEIAGFLELDPDGYIDCAYVKPKFRRKGIVSALVRHAINVCFSHGIGKICVEASLCARPMFEKLGFTLIRENYVEIKGEKLLNFSMELLKEKDLQSI